MPARYRATALDRGRHRWLRRRQSTFFVERKLCFSAAGRLLRWRANLPAYVTSRRPATARKISADGLEAGRHCVVNLALWLLTCVSDAGSSTDVCLFVSTAIAGGDGALSGVVFALRAALAI